MAKNTHDAKHENNTTEDTSPVEEIIDEQTADQNDEKTTEQALAEGPVQQNKFKRCWQWALNHKKISIPATAVVLLAALAAVPFTRYAIAGVFIKQTFPVIVVDQQTGKPVSSATVSLAGQKAETDNKGRVEVRAKVGATKLDVTKKYYKSASKNVTVPFQKPDKPFKVSLQAQGRPVPVTVLNAISKQPVANATIAGEGAEAKTDSKGKAILVVPADKQEVEVTITGKDFNSVTTKLTVTTDEVKANTFSIAPSGKIYFLSNASGKLDMVKSNLDGSERQTVLAGTGKEDRSNTVLLASRDWKYIALLSKRDGGEYSKLFLIETATDKVTVMDEGEATFNVYGWSGDRFIYRVDRAKVEAWQPKGEALKSYHAPSKKITTLAETTAEGDQDNYASEYFNYDSVYILGEEVVFIKNWNGSCRYYNGLYFCNGTPKTQGKQATFNSVRADGSQKKTIKSYSDQYIEGMTAEFGEIYINYEQDNASKVDGYHNGKLETVDQNGDDFRNKAYPDYSVSPSGNKTLFSKFIDGKDTFYVGDGKGENGKEIGRSGDYTVYGWFTDDYLLFTKDGSEMYILPAGASADSVEDSLKITDYYKPNYYRDGFGYGYGG